MYWTADGAGVSARLYRLADYRLPKRPTMKSLRDRLRDRGVGVGDRTGKIGQVRPLSNGRTQGRDDPKH